MEPLLSCTARHVMFHLAHLRSSRDTWKRLSLTRFRRPQMMVRCFGEIELFEVSFREFVTRAGLQISLKPTSQFLGTELDADIYEPRLPRRR